MALSDILTTFWREAAVLIGTSLLIVYAYCKFQLTYWKRKGVFSVPGYFPFGSIGEFLTCKKSVGEVLADIYKAGKNKPYVGYYSFSNPSILLRDLELIKKVWVKDFNNFSDRGMYHNEKDDPLSAHLLALSGMRWKGLRAKLSSTFSSGKMKFMYGTMKMCANQLVDYMSESVVKNNVIDFKDVSAKHGINIIANTAMGVEEHSFEDESDFSRITFKATEPTFVQSLRFTLPVVSKNMAKLLKLRFTPKVVENYFMEMTEKIVNYREKTKTIRNDFMQLLVELRKNENRKAIDEKSTEKLNDQEGITLREIAAQIFVFVLGAYETSSVTICYVLYELALNKDIQDRLLKEIDKADEDITYDKLQELEYLDMVLHETWRKYPPAPLIFRENEKEYKLPDGVVIPAKTTFNVSLLGLQNDPELFPNPEKFDPERFNKDNPSQVIQPFSYMPFGEGPRYCIGTRFAKMQAKVTLFKILRKFRVAIDGKTPNPIVFEPKTFMINPVGGMCLQLSLRN